MENINHDVSYNEPNEVTKAAMMEAISGHNPNKVYSSVDEMVEDILNEDN